MKDGDILLEKLAVKKRNDLFVFAVLYQPPYWHWLDYFKRNKN